jgi:hypothetical protein
MNVSPYLNALLVLTRIENRTFIGVHPRLSAALIFVFSRLTERWNIEAIRGLEDISPGNPRIRVLLESAL